MIDKSKMYRMFKKDYNSENLETARKLAFFGLFVYFGVVFLDAYIAGSFASRLVFIRTAFSLFMLGIISFTYLVSLKHHWQIIISIYIIVGGIGMTVVSIYIDSPLKSLYQQGLLIVIFYGYTLNRLLMIPAIVTGISISVFYTLVVVNCSEMSIQATVTSLFFHLVANVFGIFNMIYRRKLLLDDFSHRFNEKKYTNKVAELNKSLLQLNKKLRDKASTDGLTGIANRSFFDNSLDKMLLKSRIKELPLTLIMFDIDFFKQYNDTYGHLIGDQCLQKVCKILQHSIVDKDAIVARFGGEEFCVILPNTNSEIAKNTTKTIQLNLRNSRIKHENSKVSSYLTASFGVVTVSDNYKTVTSKKLITFADTCMYKSKHDGRNQISVAVI